ncbi:hypothetical protein A134_19525 [Vibrio crassostreae 9CS106]|uniref:hypothetical protein n=1 Tax=Vibrio coralliirubri TaxID=1516159 RepID=UPI00031838BC|nr:hypothetical protein [Vibrio coralliirubri]ANP78545.1 hypothetical protein A134_19525 [Vibrio crassostreae 9CS106]CDT99316.1 hypothetical protein VCR14J2_270061 [Vibrio coralliirubri]
MLVLKYTYKGERKEEPFELSLLAGVEEPSEIDKWDLLNLVASKIKGEPTELGPNMVNVPRGSKRNSVCRVGDTAYEFGFTSLVLLDGSELIVLVV